MIYDSESGVWFVNEESGRWPHRWLCGVMGHMWHKYDTVIRRMRTPSGSTAWGYEACTRCKAKRFVP